MLTLASSAFGFPGARPNINALAGRRSVADDSISHFSGANGVGDGGSQFLSGELEDERLLEALDRDGDVDASVRALRPRSSRRGSWESEASGWSAHFGNGTGPSGTPSVLRERSLWTTGSFRTGARSVNFMEEDASQEKSTNGHTDEHPFPTAKSEISHGSEGASQSASSEEQEEDVKTPPANGIAPSLSSWSESSADVSGTHTPRRERTMSTPKVSALTLEDIPPPLPTARTSEEQSLPTPNPGDHHSVLSTTTDTHTDTFVSAPSTPAAVL